MDLSQIKLVVTDMDGTLLNSNHEVSTLFLDLFKDLKKHNILFVAASGRPYYSIIEKLHSIKDDIIIVAENGGIVIEKDKLLLSTPIKREYLSEVETLINSNLHIHPVFCTKFKAYFKNTSATLITLLKEYYPNFQVIDSIGDVEEDIIKIALYHDIDSEQYVYPHFKHLKPNYQVKVSGKHWVDLSDNAANKGYALELLQKAYNISPNETLVFGDYYNDIEMLKLASYSFAMENAHDHVKQIALYGTKSNNELGVEHILQQLIDAKNSIN